MTAVAAPAQDMLPFELEDSAARAAPVYDDAARQVDRELCQRYFSAWCGSFGSLGGRAAGHPEISFEEFQAAADRLAEGAKGAEEHALRA